MRAGRQGNRATTLLFTQTDMKGAETMKTFKEILNDLLVWSTNDEQTYRVWLMPAIQGAESWEDTAAAVIQEYLRKQCGLVADGEQLRSIIPAEMVEQLGQRLELFFAEEIQEYAAMRG